LYAEVGGAGGQQIPQFSRPLADQTVVFVLDDFEGNCQAIPAVTDYAGRAYVSNVGPPGLPNGQYDVRVHYLGEIDLCDGRTVKLTSPVYNSALDDDFSITLCNGPQAYDNEYYFSEGSGGDVTGNVVTDFPQDLLGPNPYDPEGDPYVLASLHTQPALGSNGFLEWGFAGGFQYYCGDNNCPAVTEFRYRVTDSGGCWSEATAYLYNDEYYGE
jgi:hypothetical protein